MQNLWSYKEEGISKKIKPVSKGHREKGKEKVREGPKKAARMKNRLPSGSVKDFGIFPKSNGKQLKILKWRVP